LPVSLTALMEDLQGYDTNFGALIDDRYPFRVIRFRRGVSISSTLRR
jgi:hypothetical protein